MLAAGTILHIYMDRRGVPDLGPFTRFEFPTVGHIYDARGQPLIEFAREHRVITRYGGIPPIVRDAILATEDKRFFSHDGVDYRSVPRVLGKVRVGAWLGRLALGLPHDDGGALFPQGGSTITQQLVRGVFLQDLTARENNRELQSRARLARVLSMVIGVRNTNMVVRKGEETRLSLWLEAEMRGQFGSKLRAKQELLARYASFVYMGNGQYGFERAAQYYLGRPLTSLTRADAGAAALLAGIMKSPRDYVPTARLTGPVLRRRNQILVLMEEQGFLSADELAHAVRQPLPTVVPRAAQPFQSSAVVEHVLDELSSAHGVGIDDLLQGRIQVHATVDARVQRIASDALEHGLERYEQRHPSARGLVQGAIVVLSNRDGSILAETGGRQVYGGQPASYSNFNRARQSMRQPGSVMKPIVYLAAFRRGDFTLDTLVPDEPISVPDAREGRKWIANYDGRFKGLIPLREAFAESRNAVAIWMAGQIGIDRVLGTAAVLGVQSRLQRYVTTALGASEVNLLEMASTYRAMASGLGGPPFIVHRVLRGSGDLGQPAAYTSVPIPIPDAALLLVQEALRGVVRLPTGTAHALNARGFPIPVMGKTGTTNDFKDALFVGSTYGVDGITVAVRVGFDDNRSLGGNEAGGRVALPIFRELMLNVYAAELVGRAPAFPSGMEQRITRYLQSMGSAIPTGE
jgi:membrane peptidoglycan carboxypeptidase